MFVDFSALMRMRLQLHSNIFCALLLLALRVAGSRVKRFKSWLITCADDTAKDDINFVYFFFWIIFLSRLKSYRLFSWTIFFYLICHEWIHLIHHVEYIRKRWRRAIENHKVFFVLILRLLYLIICSVY